MGERNFTFLLMSAATASSSSASTIRSLTLAGTTSIEVGLFGDDKVVTSLQEGSLPFVEVLGSLLLQDIHGRRGRLDAVDIDFDDLWSVVGGGIISRGRLGVLSSNGGTKVPDLDAVELGNGVVEKIEGLHDLDLNIRNDGLVEGVKLDSLLLVQYHTDVSIALGKRRWFLGHLVSVNVSISIKVRLVFVSGISFSL